jgi:hypothetical protein
MGDISKLKSLTWYASMMANGDFLIYKYLIHHKAQKVRIVGANHSTQAPPYIYVHPVSEKFVP